MSDKAWLELYKIAELLGSDPVTHNGDRELVCHFCGGDYVESLYDSRINHEKFCPILKLEKYKVDHKPELFALTMTRGL